MLEVAFGHDAVTGAGGVTTELEVFLEQLLGGAADAEVRAAAVEDMVPVERNIPVIVAGGATAAAAITATSAPTRAMGATAHAFHVHRNFAALS
jgi:hypothetical protein